MHALYHNDHESYRTLHVVYVEATTGRGCQSQAYTRKQLNVNAYTHALQGEKFKFFTTCT
jgi:lipopolysaccharide export system protein LptC